MGWPAGAPHQRSSSVELPTLLWVALLSLMLLAFVGDAGGSGGDDSDFEAEAGDNGNGGRGNEHDVVGGDMLRVWWVDEQVWLRCRVDGMGREGRVVRVIYLVDDRCGEHSCTL